MNMLRVWGGGVYESDDFYDLSDSLGIMVWQDFMFAGGMYPGDEAFMKNVREEVKYQIERLRNHPCIVLWCGNNEVEEAWKNWGWQNQFNLHGADSAKVWNDYKRLFQDSLKKWVDEFDGTRPYVSTSPKNGWGRKESFTEGDSHYWGVWWGMEDWEVFEIKTVRFVSEYGMQAMPNWNTIKSFTDSSDRYLYSPVIKDHQKASDGFKKLNHYLTRYFIDSAKLSRLSLEDYTYLSQCMQYYILKNSIAVHRSKYPTNMGTLLWQLNDCWPVTSWSITDYSRQPKAAWYAVREAYRDDVLPVKDLVYPRDMKLLNPDFNFNLSGNSITITANADAKYVSLSFIGNDALLSDNYFDLKKGETKKVLFSNITNAREILNKLKIKSLYNVLVK
jgi:beta-mannosidase